MSTPDDEKRHAEVVALVERSCAEQGVPVKVTDPTVLKRVAVLLGARPR
jgi:hypothetical protein